MKIDLFDVKEFIDINKLQEVTSPVLFQRGDIPHPNGLVSNQIFGTTVQSRKNTFAYINLHGHFFHPHVYKAIKRMFRNMEKIISGEQYYIINSKGILELNENGETGIEFIYNNWEKINWEKTSDSGMRNERIDMLKNFKKDEIFMQYLLVIPPFYRDIKSTSSGGETGELNKFYTNAIRYASLLKDRDMFSFQLYQTNSNMQNLIVDIYDYFKNKLEKKTGMLRKYLLGKNVDYCTRTVITSPRFHADKPTDLETSFRYASIPISQVCSLCYPFIVKWVKDFFDREVFSFKNSKLLYDPITNTSVERELDNPESVFNDKFIKKMIDGYIDDPEIRFTKVEIPVKDDKKTRYLVFTGRRLDTESKEGVSNIAYRPMTYTDILYMAAVDVTKDKHCIITRYPVNDEFGVFINRIHVVSTTTTQPITYNEKIYKWYPMVDFSVNPEKMATKFIDSVQFSNSYLAGIAGDYDGDQTTIKILFTQEANAECEAKMNSKQFFINAKGSFIRNIGNEGIQTIYTMTKNPKDNDKVLSASDSLKFIQMKPEDITFEFLVDTFGNTTDISDGINTKASKSKFNTTDIIDIKVPYNDFKGKTTLGRLLYNKIVFEQSGLSEVFGYINKEINKGANSDIEKTIANYTKEDKVTVDQLYKYIDCRDWLGLQLHAVITTSFTVNTLKRPPEVTKLKNELIKKYKKEIEDGDPNIASLIDNELVKKTQEVLDDDIGMDLYKSGARGNMGNNFKNMYLFRGAVMNRSTGKYEILENALLDGLDKKNMSVHSNTILEGAYPKAVGTADTGYLTKQLSSGLQTEVLGEYGSDCGTKKTLDITIPKKTEDYLYRYIVENNKLVCLTPEIIENYVGKTVKMRSPMYCIDRKCICNKCAGDNFYKLGKKNLGLVAVTMGGVLLNLNMKKFHDNVIKIQNIDINDMLI